MNLTAHRNPVISRGKHKHIKITEGYYIEELLEPNGDPVFVDEKELGELKKTHNVIITNEAK